MIELGEWINLYTASGIYRIATDHWQELRAAHSAWALRSINCVLELTSIEGSEIVIAASQVGDFNRSTPATRAAQRELNAAEKAESGFVE